MIWLFVDGFIRFHRRRRHCEFRLPSSWLNLAKNTVLLLKKYFFMLLVSYQTDSTARALLNLWHNFGIFPFPHKILLITGSSKWFSPYMSPSDHEEVTGQRNYLVTRRKKSDVDIMAKSWVACHVSSGCWSNFAIAHTVVPWCGQSVLTWRSINRTT